MRTTLLAAAMAVSACHSTASADPAPIATGSAHDEAAHGGAAHDEVEGTGTDLSETEPADVRTLTALLSARHTEDLPGAEDLARYATAESSLRWLALGAETLVVRTRAATSLQHYGSAETGALLASLIAEPSTHASLRAGALVGLRGQPPERAIAAAAPCLRDTDPRVAAAAATTLAGFDEGRAVLELALEADRLGDEPLPEGGRDALEEALGR